MSRPRYTEPHQLTKRVQTRLKNRGVAFKCQRCPKSIELGQNIISRRSGKSLVTGFYHEDCWNELFM